MDFIVDIYIYIPLHLIMKINLQSNRTSNIQHQGKKNKARKNSNRGNSTSFRADFGMPKICRPEKDRVSQALQQK